MDVKSRHSTQRRARTAERTQAERRGLAETRLLEAAAELIAENGLAAVTLVNVGERAGYSRGLASHHFGSKPALLSMLVDKVQAEFTAATEPALQHRSALKSIEAVCDTFLDMLGDLPPLHRAFLVLWGEAATHDELRSRMASSDRRFRAAIAHEVSRGVKQRTISRSVSPKAYSSTLLGLLRGIALQVLIDPDGFDLDSARVEVSRNVRSRLKPTRTHRTKQAQR